MNIDGFWMLRHSDDKEQAIAITGKMIIYPYYDLAAKKEVKKMDTFTLVPETGIALASEEVYAIKFDEEDSRKPEYVVHMEMINDNPVRFISEKIMVYDGNGISIGKEYIYPQDKEIVPEDYETILCKRLNNKSSGPSFMNVQIPTEGMMTQPQGSTVMPIGTEWKCECGTVNAGNFCKECGAMRKAEPATAEESIFCPQCGEKVKALNFCEKCGSPLPKKK